METEQEFFAVHMGIKERKKVSANPTNWGSQGFSRPILLGKQTGEHSLGVLSTKALEAILAVSYSGEFAKRTWNDCVMNRATGGSGSSVQSVAELLQTPVRTVSEFIRWWDSSPTGTEDLRQMIFTVLCERKNSQINEAQKEEFLIDTRGRKTLNIMVWENEFQHEFEALIAESGPDSVVGAAELACLLESEGVSLVS